MQKNIIGVDLGATSGRVILARIGEGELRMEELHRFPNRLTEVDGRFYWDIHALYEEILRGLCVAGDRGERIASIGIDTWGVDFACVGADGELLGLPRAYRDPYTDGVPEAFFRTIPRERVYAKTGIQVMNFNSLYQLYALNREQSPALAAAERVLFMPDALSYLLTGEQVCEYTILSTSQLMNPRTRELDGELLQAAGVDASLFARRVMPGERVGFLRDEAARRTGLGRVEVFAVAGHDTASAIAAVPAADGRFAYLSSGTWSLMGVELPAPVVTEESCAMNFTNEGGVDGTTRFLKNITGMWLLEECRRAWARDGREYAYSEIMELTAAAEPRLTRIDPDDAAFAHPADMPAAIRDWCRRRGEVVPADDAALMRCIFESLAARYGEVLDRLRAIAPFPIERLHVIGGGAQNDLLNQLTADACGIPVVAGPSEATAIGNVMVQARALGLVGSLVQMRDYIRRSVAVREFLPQTK